MTFAEYQSLARRTWKPEHYDATDPRFKYMYLTLGLVSEAGEVADKVKKVMRNDDGNFSEEKKAAIAAEIGDVLWYVAMVAEEMGATLEQVAEQNIRKLTDRAQRGTIASTGDSR